MTRDTAVRPLVSILCLVYNHQDYLEDCLKGIIAQKTNFPFEVIVHDDASADDSLEVAKRYASEFPGKVVLLEEKENQCQKGMRIIDDLMLPKAAGKYIAICEGDDFWTDPGKLQMQVDFLESHKDYSACTHNTLRMDVRNGETTRMYPRSGDRDVSFLDALEGGGSHWHTSSLVYRKKYYREKDMPDFLVHSKSAGDYPRSLFLTLSGKVRFIDRDMSVYRYMTNGSWSESTARDVDSFIVSRCEIISMLELVDDYTQREYHDYIQDRCLQLKYSMCESSMDYGQLIRGDLRPLFLKRSWIYRMKTRAKRILGPVYKWYEKRKRAAVG